jgi:glutamate 5-kinase
MAAKINAVKVLNRVGISTLIVRGRSSRIILRALAGEDEGTLFIPNSARLKGRKGWIGTTASPKGWIRLDEGAVQALLRRGRSLLPSGVTDVGGEFRFGDIVELLGPGGEVLGQGLVNYGAGEVREIAGRHSREIEAILGSKEYDEVVHRNNLALIE